MFSYSFGRVDTRETCIESAQKVYLRLLLDTKDTELLSIDVLATLALLPDGSLHTETMKDMISLFRPDRTGCITLLDFVKSIDHVYKRARLLRASVRNAQKIDGAFEFIVNVVYVDMWRFDLACMSFLVH